MKIGLLTVPFNNNYGGLIQAFALKTVFSEMGHDVIFLNRQRDLNSSIKFRIYRLLVKLHIIDDYLKKRGQKLSVYTDQFKKKYLMPITNPYYSSEDFCEIKKLGIDMFVVGSDQVWRYAYAGNSIGNFFFDILKDSTIPRFSYAASFGVDYFEYPEGMVKGISECLNLFKGVSVREQTGVYLLEKYFQMPPGKVRCVLDPTMLLSSEVYLKLFENKQVDKGYVFTYVLDKTVVDENAINKIACMNKVSRKDMKAQTGDLGKLGVIEPVEDWLSSIYYSDYVITDSFHGTVFSILFNKQFVVVSNNNRGAARLNDLLSPFNLKDHMVEKLNEDCYTILNSEINWDVVNEKIRLLKDESMRFINDMIG